MPRSHRTASPSSGAPAPALAAAAPQAQEEASTGFMGFLERTGQAIGDGFDSARDRVGGWVDSAGEAVDDLSQSARRWGRTAREAADLDYGLGWGTVSARGTLTDILEIGVAAEAIPADLLRILEGATASNVISLRYDYGSGSLSIDAADLQVRNVAVSGMQIGTANLTGVSIRVQSDRIELIGSEQQGNQAEVRAASCEALDVRYQTADGPMTASRMVLTGLVLRASSRAGQVLEGDVTGSVQADEAAIEGFDGAGVTMEEGRIGGLSADLTEGGERASVNLGRIDAAGVTQGGVALGNATAEGVEIEITNEGGGLPMVDERPDQLGGNVRVQAASVREFSHPMASLDQASLEQAMVQFGENGTVGTVAGLQAGGLDTQWADAEDVDADNLSVRLDGSGITAGVGGLSATGLSSEQGGAAGVTASDVRFRQGAGGSEASIAELRADGIDAAADARRVSASGLAASWSGEGEALTANARLGSIQAEGVTSEQGSVDSVALRGGSFALAGGRNEAGIDSIEVRGASSAFGGAERATLGRTEANWTGSGEGLAATATVGGIAAEGVQSQYADVASLGADPISIRHADGNTHLRTDRIGASGVAGPDVGASSLAVAGLSADLGPNGTVRANAGQIDAEALTAYGASVDQARLTGADLAMDERGTQVGLQELDVASPRYGDVAAADRLTASDARIGIRSPLDLDASVGDFRIQGLDASNFSAGDVRGAGIDVGMDHGRTEARVASASLADATVADRFDIASGRVQGVTAAVTGSDVRDVSLRTASAEGVRDRTTGSSARSAELTGVDYANSPDRMRASVDHLGLSGTRFDSGNLPSSGGSGGSGGSDLDMDALIRSASRRVDDADVAFDIGVNPMESLFADIAPGTRARGQVTARDNQLTNVNVGLTTPVDGPLWIEGHGVYTDRQGRVRADLSGWFDHKVSGFANDALGIEGDRLPSLSQVGDGVAGLMGGPPSQGGESAPPVDLASSRIQGAVGLSPGRIEAGAGRIDLAQQRAGDNVVQFDSQHGRDLAVSASRILASGISASSDGSRVATGQTSIADASVQAQLGDRSSRIRGEVGAVSVAGLQFDGPGTAQPFTPIPRASEALQTSLRPVPRPDGLGSSAPTTSARPVARPSTTPAATGAQTYTVRAGDNLTAIARRNGTTVAAISAANGISDPNRIAVGQVLRLP